MKIHSSISLMVALSFFAVLSSSCGDEGMPALEGESQAQTIARAIAENQKLVQDMSLKQAALQKEAEEAKAKAAALAKEKAEVERRLNAAPVDKRIRLTDEDRRKKRVVELPSCLLGNVDLGLETDLVLECNAVPKREKSVCLLSVNSNFSETDTSTGKVYIIDENTPPFEFQYTDPNTGITKRYKDCEKISGTKRAL
jgi:hypothetical protein